MRCGGGGGGDKRRKGEDIPIKQQNPLKIDVTLSYEKNLKGKGEGHICDV